MIGSDGSDNVLASFDSLLNVSSTSVLECVRERFEAMLCEANEDILDGSRGVYCLHD